MDDVQIGQFANRADGRTQVLARGATLKSLLLGTWCSATGLSIVMTSVPGPQGERRE